jgi:hypothetical protein
MVPEYPGLHMQEYPFNPSTQTPLLPHELLAQSSMSVTNNNKNNKIKIKS